MITITINDKEISVPDNTTILDAAQTVSYTHLTLPTILRV